MTDYKQLCVELAALAKREHYYCEDSWYSCPKATDGCADDFQGSDCNCGADAHNAKVDALVAALAEPAPKGPTDEELAEFLQQLTYKEMSESSPFGAPSWDPDKEHQRELSRVRAVLARWGNYPGSLDSSTPQPVPVSERLPGPEDCDAEGRCWLLGKVEGDWRLINPAKSGVPQLKYCFTHWLPAHALPLPS